VRDRRVLAVAGLTVLGLALRLAGIRQSLAGDELFTYAAVVGRPLTDVFSAVKEGGENSPPFFFVLSWAAAKLGDPSVTIRLPSVLLGTATIPLLYALGARTVGRNAGLVAAGLLALSPFALFYSVEARSYATLIFLVTLSSLALVRALEDGRARWWALYALASCAVLYTHYFGVFVLAVQAAWVLAARRGQVRPLLAANAAVALAYLPWLPSFFGQHGDEIDVLAFYKPLNAGAVARESLRLFPGHPEVPWNELPGRAATLALAGAVVVAAVVAGRDLAARRDWRSRPRLGSMVTLVVLLAVASPLGFLAYSAAGPETFIARYLSPSLPAILLLLGLLLAALPRGLAPALTAIVLVAVSVGTVKALEQANERPDYREAAHFVDERVRPGDEVVDRSITLGASSRRLRRGGRQTSLAVYLGHDSQIADRPELPPAVRRAAPGRRIFVVGPRAAPDLPAGWPARLLEQRDYAGTVPLRVLVYLRTPGPVPAAPRATDAERRAPVIRRCLRTRGFASSPRPDSEPGVPALDVELPGGGRAVVVIHDTAAAARAALPRLRAFLGRTGGDARTVGSALVGYVGAPDPGDAARVEGCL
jgi:mannosyltransferase